MQDREKKSHRTLGYVVFLTVFLIDNEFFHFKFWQLREQEHPSPNGCLREDLGF